MGHQGVAKRPPLLGHAVEGMVFGPTQLAMCFDCIAKADLNADLEFSGNCSFCTDTIGVLDGRFTEGRVRASVVCGVLAMCSSCLELMKDIVEVDSS